MTEHANTILSHARMENYVTQAKDMVEALTNATDILGENQWSYSGSKNGITLYCIEGDNVNVNVPCNVHAGCKMNGGIEEVSESLVVTNTTAYKSTMRSLYPDFVDGVVLENILLPSYLHPYRYVGLKWIVFKSNSSFTSDHDFVILEYIDLIEDDQGEKIAFQVYQSVDVPPSIDGPYGKSSNLSRGRLPILGYMFHTTNKPDELHMSYSCSVESTPGILSHVKKLLNAKIKYITSVRTKRDAIILVQQVIPTSEQDFCRLCEKTFGIWRRRHNCYKCGGVICGTCSSVQVVHVQVIGERNLRVCTPCVSEARRTARSEAFSALAGTSLGLNEGGADNARSSLSSCSSSVHSIKGESINFELDDFVAPMADDDNVSPSIDHADTMHELLEPVRELLKNYQNISSCPTGPRMPKANFLNRSFSSGRMGKKRSFLVTKRRGSPVDLAMGIDSRRSRDVRIDDSDSDMESHGSSNQSPIHSVSRAGIFRDQVNSDCTVRPRLVREKRTASDGPRFFSSRALDNDILEAAIARSQGLLEATEVANELAQHMRRAAHHRIRSLQLDNEAYASAHTQSQVMSTFHDNPIKVLRTPPFSSLPSLAAPSGICGKEDFNGDNQSSHNKQSAPVILAVE
uniref:Uncharacterized protein AlNc14C17G1815 n=1 Tax=Albugo laibachii Nc14 TaxID=890382 RepID=F0W4J5_9STRA|nr:sporangia induced hypothetical protein [Albugo laibachii Nc14]|eukprot:CCA16028.1 sporangia induced hypothetical protein [Albugo laibachii Nc14]